MKKLFYLSVFLFIFFEIANVYFIMPMPGSQDMNSIDLAYFLYRWRWIFRLLLAASIIFSLAKSTWKHKWFPFVLLVPLLAVIYLFNFEMSADEMFKQPEQLIMSPAKENKTDTSRLVIGVVTDNEARAYPIQYIGYHHHVQDTISGKPILVTYCTVCRSGRVYEPIVNGKHAIFRLVGMDHFNAMLEDQATKSWWRQATGVAIAGRLKGEQLSEIPCIQTTLNQWLALYPSSFVMQADPTYVSSYDSTMKYESGKSRKKLTGTDSLSWKKKSWVVGIKHNNQTKAYDWNQLQNEKIIYDSIGPDSIVLVLANDNRSFFAYVQPTGEKLQLRGDTLLGNIAKFSLNGKGLNTSMSLQRVNAYQEFWHSWETFQPQTTRY